MGKEVVNDGGAIKLMKGGKVISTGDYDRGAGVFFMNVKGKKGQQSFDEPEDILKIKEEDDLDEWKTLNANRRVAGGDKRRKENKELKEDDLDEGGMKGQLMKVSDLITTLINKGGVDKSDYETAQGHVEDGDMKGLATMVKRLDTEPKEAIINAVAKGIGKKEAEKIFKVRILRVEEADLDEGYMELEFKDKRTAEKAYNYINNEIWAGGNPPYDDFNQEGNTLQIDTDANLNRRNQMLKDLKDLPRNMKFKVVVNEHKGDKPHKHPHVDEGARSDARRAMMRDKDLRRGKDSADKDDSATDDDVKAASKNIIMQMRKAQSLKGRFAVEFADGKKVKIPAKMAMAVQQKYNSMKKPADKEKFQAKVAKSYRDMLSALKEAVSPAQQAAIAISKKERGEKPKKESILARVDRKIKEKKDG